jgi:hypothetical protein
MSSSASLTSLKLKTARERCLAITYATRHFHSKIQSSPATRTVVTFIERCAAKILSLLDAEVELDVLTEDEVERRIHRVTKYVPTLHALLGVVERSDVVAVPAELASPLRRTMHAIYKDRAELVVTSSMDLNYSVQELTREYLAELLSELRLDENDFGDFPDTLFVATLPSIEYDQALQHCIFAHELAHPLWERKQIGEKLGKFEVNRVKIAEIIQTLKAQAAQLDAAQTELPLEAISIVARVPERVQRATQSWCKELSSDLFGFMLFGPAFLFSLVHFLCSFVRLDSASESHPPPRLRLQLLFRLLDQLYPKTSFSSQTLKFLDDWRDLAFRPIAVEGTINELVLWSFRKSDADTRLVKIVKENSSELDVYTDAMYRADVQKLCPLIDTQIPPAEILDPSTRLHVPASFVGILSAGWESYLLGLGRYSKSLPAGKVKNTYDVARHFNGFLLKAFELNECAAAWKEEQ